MKLLSCHVDNFGKLSNYDYQFVEGLNVIQEHNGFGKSTLAAFIKAMFYVFPRTGKRSVAEEEITINNNRVLEMEQAEKSLSELVIKDEDIQCEARWREVFVDEEETLKYIRLCQNKCDKLVEVANQTIQMGKEELVELERLKKLFEQGVPTE